MIEQTIYLLLVAAFGSLLGRGMKAVGTIILVFLLLSLWIVDSGTILGLRGVTLFLFRIIISAPIAFTFYAYFSEGQRDISLDDSFKKFKLFFRYGIRFYDLSLPIVISKKEEIGSFTQEYFEFLKEQVEKSHG